MKRLIVFISIAAFVAALSGCATVDYSNPHLSGKEKRKLEKEGQYNFIKGISAFAGFAIGGLTGVVTANGNDKVPSMLKGCLIGAIAGLAAGYVVTENMKNIDDNPNPKPDTSRIDEYFRDYQNMNGN